MPLATLLPIPSEAFVMVFVLVAVPITILMTAWTVVTMVRILFPERDLPFDPSARRRRARERGESVPVGFRDLMEDQRHARSPAMPARPAADASPTQEVPLELVEDLWLRRN